MSIWGKLAAAAVRLSIGGPIGTLLSGVAGQYTNNREQEHIPAKDQVAFTVGVIALGAKMGKADGVVTTDEVNAFKEVFKVPEGEIQNVARIFNLSRQYVAGYEAYAEQLGAMFKGNRRLLELGGHGHSSMQNRPRLRRPDQEEARGATKIDYQ